MHWILMSERSDEYELSIDELPPILESLDLHFDCGNPIPGSLPRIDVPYSQHPEQRKTDNIVAPTRLGLLVNGKVKRVFDALGIQNIQYFDARLTERNNGNIDKRYTIANVIGKHACLDEQNSELELFDDGDIQFIDRLSLALNDDTDYGHIFRLGEFPSILIISSALKRMLEEHEITGFKIYKPDAFSL